MADHLHRSRDDRMLAGVAGGLAEMWDADPSLVRIVWALLTIFTGGLAFVVYIVMAIVVPEEDDEYVPAPPPTSPAPMAPVGDQASAQATTPAADAAATPGMAAAVPGFAAPPSVPSAPPTYWMPGSGVSPADARRARRAARRQRGDSSAPVVIGVFLVLLGGFFLARQWLPELDWDWFWPAMLIALGVLLLVLALTRHPNEPGAPS